MIFVTVGTHEEQFDRLIKEMDKLVENKIINEEVYIQTGYSTYVPKFCDHSPLVNYDEMENLINKAHIVITHGGPGSIMSVLSKNKIPIVVPRMNEFKEHVDNHQVLFTKRVEYEGKVLGIYEISNLQETIINYNKIIKTFNNKLTESNLDNFVLKLKKTTNKLLAGVSK